MISFKIWVSGTVDGTPYWILISRVRFLGTES